MTDKSAEEKRLVLSFDLKEESEDGEKKRVIPDNNYEVSLKEQDSNSRQ